MTDRTVTQVLRTLLLGTSLVFVVACGEERGPLEQVADDIEDAVGEPGPAEHAGERLGETAGEVGEAIDGVADDVREGAQEAAEGIREAVE